MYLDEYDPTRSRHVKPPLNIVFSTLVELSSSGLDDLCDRSGKHSGALRHTDGSGTVG
jgi:hypothetical protein